MKDASTELTMTFLIRTVINILFNGYNMSCCALSKHLYIWNYPIKLYLIEDKFSSFSNIVLLTIILARIEAFVWAHFFISGCGGFAAATRNKKIASAESGKSFKKVIQFLKIKKHQQKIYWCLDYIFSFKFFLYFCYQK